MRTNLKFKLINIYVKINVYINGILYKSMDLIDQEKYNPRFVTEEILAQKQNNTLPDKFLIQKGLSIKVEKISD